MKFVPIWFVFGLLFLELGADQLARDRLLIGYALLIGMYFCAFEILYISATHLIRADKDGEPEGEEGEG